VIADPIKAAASEMEDQQNNILGVSAYSCSPPNSQRYEFVTDVWPNLKEIWPLTPGNPFTGGSPKASSGIE
jgi:hypothetical protein